MDKTNPPKNNAENQTKKYKKKTYDKTYDYFDLDGIELSKTQAKKQIKRYNKEIDELYVIRDRIQLLEDYIEQLECLQINKIPPKISPRTPQNGKNNGNNLAI